jgi:hypothetical protein
MLKHPPVARFRSAVLRGSALAFCVFLWALVLARAASAQDPHIITFDVPVAGTLATVPDDINPEGTVVGFYFDENFVGHGFLRSPNGQFTTFDAPGAGTMVNNPIPGGFAGTFPLEINPFGTVVGYYTDDNLVSHCFIRTANGNITTFDAPGADTNPTDAAGSQLMGINPLGLTVGNYVDSTPAHLGHGFLRTPGGHFTSFDAASDAVSTFPVGPINLEGALVGFYLDPGLQFHAFVRNPGGKIATFDGPGSCTGGIPADCYSNGDLNINVFGWSVGGFEDTSFVHHGFLRSPDRTLTIFDAPWAGDTGPYQGTDFSYNFVPDGSELAGLNDLGAVAAMYADANNVYHGFLRSPDGKFTRFDAPGADLTPGDLNGTFPFAINDLGVIVGIYTDANYLPHGFIREP